MYNEVNSKILGGLLEEKKNNDTIVIIYHWNSCGHCKILMDMINDLLMSQSNIFNRSNVFGVEYNNFKYLPDELTDVNAFPMIIAYENGKKKEEFKEQRTKENLEKFIKENSSKTSSKSSSSSSSTKTPKKQLKQYTKVKSISSKSKSKK
jgi:thioredoxin-like negative regulator of GroEL